MALAAPTATASRSSLGPLLKIYTAPAICSNFAEPSNQAIAWRAQGCSDGNIVDTSSCWPPALTSAPGQPYQGWGFYSPGLICPSGYTSACTAALDSNGSPSTITSGTSYDFQFPLIAGETAVGCCPTGFTCTGTYQTCVSALTSGSYLAGFCSYPTASLVNFQYVNIPAENTFNFQSQAVVESLTAVDLYAPLFQLNWQSSDRPASSTTSSSSSPSTSSTTSSSTATTTPTGTPNNPGLSTGAAVAIGVVIPLVVLAIVGVLAFLMIRRRRRRLTGPSTGPSTGPPPPPPTTPGKGSQKPWRASELPATRQYQELDTLEPASAGKGYQPLPQELDAAGAGRRA